MKDTILKDTITVKTRASKMMRKSSAMNLIKQLETGGFTADKDSATGNYTISMKGLIIARFSLPSSGPCLVTYNKEALTIK